MSASICASSIERGLREGRKFVLVITSNFIGNRGWTSMSSTQFSRARSWSSERHSAVWHNVTRDQVFAFSPFLADPIGRQLGRWCRRGCSPTQTRDRRLRLDAVKCRPFSITLVGPGRAVKIAALVAERLGIPVADLTVAAGASGRHQRVHHLRRHGLGTRALEKDRTVADIVQCGLITARYWEAAP
jgi:hypothetical protein